MSMLSKLASVASHAPPGSLGALIANKAAAKGALGAGLTGESLAAQYKSSQLQGLAKLGSNEYAMEKGAQQEMAANEAGMNAFARTNMQQMQLRSLQASLSSLASFNEAHAKVAQKTASNIAQAV